jgi:hypothetical protein
MCYHNIFEYFGCGCSHSDGFTRCVEAVRQNKNCDRRQWESVLVGYREGTCETCLLVTPPDTPPEA